MTRVSISSPVFLERLAEQFGVSLDQLKAALIRNEWVTPPINIVEDTVAIRLGRLFWIDVVVLRDGIGSDMVGHVGPELDFIFKHISNQDLAYLVGTTAYQHAYQDTRNELSFVDVVYGLFAAHDSYRFKDDSLLEEVFRLLCCPLLRDGLKECYKSSRNMNQVAEEYRSKLENSIGIKL